jgi:hypothetical protein
VFVIGRKDVGVSVIGDAVFVNVDEGVNVDVRKAEGVTEGT